jgi:hypothetical protein
MTRVALWALKGVFWNTFIKERNKLMTGKEKDKDREITFEIEEHFGVINVSPTGWKKELNLVSWNGHTAKYDLREWNEDHSHMSKGITMAEDEIKALTSILNGLQAK